MSKITIELSTDEYIILLNNLLSIIAYLSKTDAKVLYDKSYSNLKSVLNNAYY